MQDTIFYYLKMLFSFLSFTQNIAFILLILFWILAQLPLTVFAANMWYTLLIFSLTILIIGNLEA